MALYQQWLKAWTEAGEQALGMSPGGAGGKEAWKPWMDGAMTAWEAAATTGTDVLGLLTQWTEMLEEARAKLLAGQSFPTDPLTFSLQLYNATSETWSKAVGDVIGTEAFVSAASRFMESYTSYSATFRRLAQEYYSTLQLATRPDIARVASLVVAVENKVDHLEELLDEIEGSTAQMAGGTRALSGTLDAVAGRLEQVERSLTQTASGAAKMAASEKDLGRLERLETKMVGLESDLRRMQSTLEQLLTAVEKAATGPKETTDTVAARKPPAKKPVDEG
jgi:methyl-accepting chemotaxis protein